MERVRIRGYSRLLVCDNLKDQTNKTMQTLCKCGKESKGTQLIKYYKRRDGTMSKYIQIEKRCQDCMNKAKKKYKITKESFIGYLKLWNNSQTPTS